MDAFQKCYCELCDELFLPLGFQRLKKNNSHHTIAYCRVINGLFQSFELERIKRFGSISSYRIGFSVIPLCMDVRQYEYIITEGSGYGSNYLKELGDPKTYGDSWEVNALGKDSIQEAVCEMRSLFTERLIPFFNEAVSYGAAFDAITNTVQQMEANRRAYLQNHFKENLCKDYSFLKYDDVRALLALKCRNYSYAKEYYNWYLELEARKLVEFEELVKNDASASGKLTKRREHVQKIREMKEKVDAEDIECIEKKLNENEEYAKSVLKECGIVIINKLPPHKEERFSSFDEIAENLSRGGEIEFMYSGRHFSITHDADNQEDIDLVLLCDVDQQSITEYRVHNMEYSAIGDYVIENQKLKDIVPSLEITFRCF